MPTAETQPNPKKSEPVVMLGEKPVPLSFFLDERSKYVAASLRHDRDFPLIDYSKLERKES